MKKHRLCIQTTFLPRENLLHLEEWLHYHLLAGVDHFYLYDNTGSVHKEKIGQNDGVNKYGFHYGKLLPHLSDEQVQQTMGEMLGQGELAGRCTVVRWQPRDAGGNIVYNQRDSLVDCARRFGEEAEWMAFIDVDEFLFCPGAGSLREVLTALEKKGVSCGVLLQKKFADRFMHLDRGVAEIEECIQDLDTRGWAPKNVVKMACLAPERIKNIHEFMVSRGKTQVLDPAELRFNHYNVNPTHLKWLEQYYRRAGIALDGRDAGLLPFRARLAARCGFTRKLRQKQAATRLEHEILDRPLPGKPRGAKRVTAKLKQWLGLGVK